MKPSNNLHKFCIGVIDRHGNPWGAYRTKAIRQATLVASVYDARLSNSNDINADAKIMFMVGITYDKIGLSITKMGINPMRLLTAAAQATREQDSVLGDAMLRAIGKGAIFSDEVVINGKIIKF